MYQLVGFRDITHPDYVFLLKKSLYGLKQAPQTWWSFRISVEICGGNFERARTSSCRPSATSVNTKAKSGADSGSKNVSDQSHFCSLAGALQYLTFTRPNISYVVQHISLHIYDHVKVT